MFDITVQLRFCILQSLLTANLRLPNKLQTLLTKRQHLDFLTNSGSVHIFLATKTSIRLHNRVFVCFPIYADGEKIGWTIVGKASELFH